MEYLNVIAAAAAAWIFGAVWYGMISARWMAASGLTKATIDLKNPVPYIGSFICALSVAGMTRHILGASGVTTIGGGIATGLGLGLFVVAPWIATNVLFGQRDRNLIWMDGIYPAIAMALMGLVLTLF